jgi:WhiB family redox-sensing transcriptional regulator
MDQPDQQWRAAALCAQTDPDIFFPERGQNPWAAKRICAACAVRVDCLTDALQHSEPYGVRGGLTANERKQLRRQARGKAA